MHKRVLRRKPFSVDAQSYEVSITAIYDGKVELRVTIRADFGHRSFCTIRGLRNFDYYYNYGDWACGESTETNSAFAITPRMAAALIRHARRNGWSPETCPANHEIELTNVDAIALLARDPEKSKS
jgi:hypothetical protein